MAFRLSIRQAARALGPATRAAPGTLVSGEHVNNHLSKGQVVREQFSTAVIPAEYEKRNYAKDVIQYTDYLYKLNNFNRHFLLRDVYEDMLLDGIQPDTDAFVPIFVGCMKGGRLQDAFYFYEEMKTMGYIPDDLTFNCLIATCGRCRQQRRAFQVVEEMMHFGMRPKLKTLTALLGVCGAAGLPKEAAGVVQRITESGLALNKYCYAALIAAEKNQTVKKNDSLDKIIEILGQARQLAGFDIYGSGRDGGDVIDEIDEYIYALPTIDFVRGRANIVDRRLTAYHAAFAACADLKSTSALRSVVELLRQEGFQPDLFCVAQILRCHLACQEYGTALKALNGYLSSGRQARTELFYVFILEAMKGFTREGMETAKKVMQDFLNRGLPLTNKMHSDLLELAAQEPGGDFSMANLLFDLMQKRKANLPRRVIDMYLRGLKRRKIPEGDSRLTKVTEIMNRRAPLRIPGQQKQLEA